MQVGPGSNGVLYMPTPDPVPVPLFDRIEGVEPLGVRQPEGEDAYIWYLESKLPLPEYLFRADGSLTSEAIKAAARNISTTEDLVARYGKHLSREQRKVLRAVAEGKSVFFTGAAGTGKSLTLRSIIQMLRDKYSMCTKQLAVTASTGVAALNIGGETLHSFAGVGLGKRTIGGLCRMLSEKAKRRWRDLEILIIDEISMVDGYFFDKLEEIAQIVRGNSNPFGGVQLVLCGDFFQLPPVPDRYHGAPVPICFAFDAKSWNSCVALQMQLTKVFRQKDPTFVEILNKLRLGMVDGDMERKFRHLNRSVACNGIEPICIYPRNLQVEKENNSRLEMLPGDKCSYKAIDCGRWYDFELGKPDEHQRRISNHLDKYSVSPGLLELRIGAQVMLIRNIVQGRLVNGSLGRVFNFLTVLDARSQGITSAPKLIKESLERDAKSSRWSLDELLAMRGVPTQIPDIAWPVVEFANCEKILMSPLSFDMEDAFGCLEATRVQVPLILAWAISIHKSQGQTIERLKIDFEGTFENGQAYVAMSRATGMDALQILNFDPVIVKAHPRVLDWYKDLLVEGEMDSEEAVATYFSQ